MPARDLTKKERTLFYVNIGLFAFAFIYARVSSGNDVVLRGITSSVHGIVSQIISLLAVVGVILVLMSGQFTKGWDVLYIVLQILSTIGIFIALLMFFLGTILIPTSASGITDPETLESLRQTTHSIRGFLDRNPDFPSLYTQLHQTLNICGFYDKKDELGIGCPYNIKTVCESETSVPFLSMLLQALQSFFSVATRNMVLIAVIEIIVFIFLISAYRSIDTKEMKVNTTADYSLSLPTDNKPHSEEKPTTTYPVNSTNSANSAPYYYAQPVSSQLALPVNTYSTVV